MLNNYPNLVDSLVAQPNSAFQQPQPPPPSLSSLLTAPNSSHVINEPRNNTEIPLDLTLPLQHRIPPFQPDLPITPSLLSPFKPREQQHIRVEAQQHVTQGQTGSQTQLQSQSPSQPSTHPPTPLQSQQITPALIASTNRTQNTVTSQPQSINPNNSPLSQQQPQQSLQQPSQQFQQQQSLSHHFTNNINLTSTNFPTTVNTSAMHSSPTPPPPPPLTITITTTPNISSPPLPTQSLQHHQQQDQLSQRPQIPSNLTAIFPPTPQLPLQPTIQVPFSTHPPLFTPTAQTQPPPLPPLSQRQPSQPQPPSSPDFPVQSQSPSPSLPQSQLQPQRPTQTHRTNIHYIHPLTTHLTPSALHNPHSNAPPSLLPPPPPKQTIAARAIQHTIQSLDDEMFAFLYTNFKAVFELFEIYDFDSKYLLEFTLCVKSLFFLHFEFQNKSSYLSALQNVCLGRRLNSSIFDRLYITPIFSATRLIFAKLLNILKVVGVGLFGESIKLFIAIIKPFFVLIKSRFNRNFTLPLVVSSCIKPVQLFFTKINAAIKQINPFRDSASHYPSQTQVSPHQSLPSHLPTVIPPSTLNNSPNHRPWQNYPSSARISQLPYNSSSTHTPGLTLLQRVLLFTGSIIIPYAFRSLERKMRLEDWQWRDEGENEAQVEPSQQSQAPTQPQAPSLESTQPSQQLDNAANRTKINSTDLTTSPHLPPQQPQLPESTRTKLISFLNSLLNHFSAIFSKISTKSSTTVTTITASLHTLLTTLYKTEKYHKRVYSHFLSFNLILNLVTFLNTLVFIHNGEYLTPLHRLLNITKLCIDPTLPLPPPIFDSLHQGITTGLIQDLLVWVSNVVLSLTNTSSTMWLLFPALLPISFFLRSTVQQVISTQEQLQQQYQSHRTTTTTISNHNNNNQSTTTSTTTPQPRPITLLTHCKLIYRRLLGYDEHALLWDEEYDVGDQSDSTTSPSLGINNNDSYDHIPNPKTVSNDEQAKSKNNNDSLDHPTLSPTTSSLTPMSKQHQQALQQRYNRFYTPLQSSSLRCTLCHNTPTLPCRLSSCPHVYCWYCVQQLFNAKQVCVDCLKPILGFQTWGKPVHWESVEHFINRSIAQAGGNVAVAALAASLKPRKTPRGDIGDDSDHNDVNADHDNDDDNDDDDIGAELEARVLEQQQQLEQNHEIRRFTTAQRPKPQVIATTTAKNAHRKRKR